MDTWRSASGWQAVVLQRQLGCGAVNVDGGGDGGVGGVGGAGDGVGDGCWQSGRRWRKYRGGKACRVGLLLPLLAVVAVSGKVVPSLLGQSINLGKERHAHKSVTLASFYSGLEWELNFAM